MLVIGFTFQTPPSLFGTGKICLWTGHYERESVHLCSLAFCCQTQRRKKNTTFCKIKAGVWKRITPPFPFDSSLTWMACSVPSSDNSGLLKCWCLAPSINGWLDFSTSTDKEALCQCRCEKKRPAEIPLVAEHPAFLFAAFCPLCVAV